jgi:hypothetical protein
VANPKSIIVVFMNYKKHYIYTDMKRVGGKRARVTRGPRDPRHGKGMPYIDTQTYYLRKHRSTRNFHATTKTQYVEATSGASPATRGSTATLAAHGVGEERSGKRRHPNRGRSTLHTVRGG